MRVEDLEKGMPLAEVDNGDIWRFDRVLDLRLRLLFDIDAAKASVALVLMGLGMPRLAVRAIPGELIERERPLEEAPDGEREAPRSRCPSAVTRARCEGPKLIESMFRLLGVRAIAAGLPSSRGCSCTPLLADADMPELCERVSTLRPMLRAATPLPFSLLSAVDLASALKVQQAIKATMSETITCPKLLSRYALEVKTSTGLEISRKGRLL